MRYNRSDMFLENAKDTSWVSPREQKWTESVLIFWFSLKID